MKTELKTSLYQSLEGRVAAAEARAQELQAAIPHAKRDPDLLSSRRDAFAQAAYEKVSSEGYASMNVGDVARVAGVDKRTMYDYIGDKQDLLYLVFLNFLPRQLAFMVTAARGGQNPEDCIRQMASAHIDYLDQYDALALVYYRELRHLNREQITEVLWLIRQVIGSYEDAISWGIETGDFEVENAHISARVAAAAVDMKALARWDLRDESEVQIQRTVISMIIKGLGAK